MPWPASTTSSKQRSPSEPTLVASRAVAGCDEQRSGHLVADSVGGREVSTEALMPTHSRSRTCRSVSFWSDCVRVFRRDVLGALGGHAPESWEWLILPGPTTPGPP